MIKASARATACDVTGAGQTQMAWKIDEWYGGGSVTGAATNE